MQTSQCVLIIIHKVSAVLQMCRHSLPPLLFVFSVSAGEGGLEVRRHGCGPDLPVDVHHRVSVGDSRPLPAPVALWDVLEQKQISKE